MNSTETKPEEDRGVPGDIAKGRYFFHVNDGVDIADEIGTELASYAEVRSQAIRFSGQAIHDLGLRFWNTESWRLDVVDGAGNPVLSLAFSATPATGGVRPA